MPMPANVKKYNDKYWDIYQVGTLPPSGPMGVNMINGEFGRGTSIANYRGTQWWTDVYGQTGTFTPTGLGFNQFYGKRGSSPPPPHLLDTTMTAGRATSTGFTYTGYSNGAVLPGFGGIANPNFSGSSITLLAQGFSPVGSQYIFRFGTNNMADNWSTLTIAGLGAISRGGSAKNPTNWSVGTNLNIGNGGSYRIIID